MHVQAVKKFAEYLKKYKREGVGEKRQRKKSVCVCVKAGITIYWQISNQHSTHPQAHIIIQHPTRYEVYSK